MIKMSTICAVSTPNAVGGISVIRMSGEDAVKIAAKIFQPFGGKAVEKMAGHTCVYGKIVSENEVIDDGLLTVFLAPKSYTGENTAEISCHGGLLVTQKVLEACISAGAEPALAGEFTKRAFLNGKLSLSQAEAVADLISASGSEMLKSANSMREGSLYRSVKKTTDSLVALLGDLAAWVDYPEEDIPEVDPKAMLSTLDTAQKSLKKVLSDYSAGRIFREGIETAVVGKPNVGKSTFMNMLLGYQRSIVTDIAGTTRDIVEESVRLGDVVLKVSDTAGIRQTDDVVESMGVELAKRCIERAELIIAVFDGSREFSDDDLELCTEVSSAKESGAKCIAVVNKTDLERKFELLPQFQQVFDSVVEISAVNPEERDKITKAVFDIFKLSNTGSDARIFVNERQKLCIENAVKCLDEAVSCVLSGVTLDGVTVLIDKAAQSLMELSGEKVSDSVVNEVFSRFCVGK